MVRFSSRGPRALAVAALLASGLVAAHSAQAAVPYSIVGPTTSTYQFLQGGTEILKTGTSENVTLPFDFRFYDATHKSVTVSLYGFASFAGGSTASANTGIPHNSTGTTFPTTFIAPWWDSLARITSVTAIRHATFGTAPSRRFTIEWRDVSNTNNTSVMRWSFQLTLFESTNQIRVAYSVPTNGTSVTLSGAVGIQEDLNSGIPLLSCTTSASGTCATANIPGNKVYDVFMPADLSLASLGGENTGYAGVAYRANVILKNQGGRVAQMARVRFYLSTDAVYDAADKEIGESTPADVQPISESLVSAVGLIPSGTAPGSYFLIARADPDNALVELSETNNSLPAIPITVGAPTPDLQLGAITVPAAATPGQTISVTRTIRNGGNAVGPAEVRYSYLISSNSVVSVSDPVVGAAHSLPGVLAAGAAATGTDMVTLPASLAAGRYWLGICVDYDPAATPVSSVTEISEHNNCAASGSFLVNSGALTVLTTTLEGATQFAPYGLRLQASGGDGTYVWALTAGSLPNGMELTPAGDLTGTPSAAGAFSFDVKVTSAGEEKTQALSLQVTPANMPLAIVDQQLPVAEFSRLYEASLIAVGGKPRYLWALKEGSQLPAGLALAEDGRIEGRASESGRFPFSVEITDRDGTKAAKDLEITVIAPTSMHIATSRLATAAVGEEYSQPLQAVGARGATTWTVTGLQKLAENPTEAPGPVLTMLPADFGLQVGMTATGWVLSGTPRQAGSYAITVACSDGYTNDVTTLPLRVSYASALAITTTALPDAFVGQEYVAGLSHNAGRIEPSPKFSSPCIQQVDSTLMTWSCAPADPLQALPAGVQLKENGELRGVPAAPEGVTADASGNVTYSFLVKVADESGREDVRSLSIKVRPAPAPFRSGCASAGMMPSAFALLGLLGLTFRRGRRR